MDKYKMKRIDPVKRLRSRVKKLEGLPVCSVCPGKKSDKEDGMEMIFGPEDECKCTAKFGSPGCSQWLYGWFCGTYGELSSS